MLVDKNEPSEAIKYRPSANNTAGWEKNKAISGALVVVEISKSQIHWMEPQDFTLDKVAAVLAGSSSTDTQINGLAIISADGNVQILNKDAALQRLQNMVNAAKKDPLRKSAGDSKRKKRE